jgi:hypothetical protein
LVNEGPVRLQNGEFFEVHPGAGSCDLRLQVGGDTTVVL